MFLGRGNIGRELPTLNDKYEAGRAGVRPASGRVNLAEAWVEYRNVEIVGNSTNGGFLREALCSNAITHPTGQDFSKNVKLATNGRIGGGGLCERQMATLGVIRTAPEAQFFPGTS